MNMRLISFAIYLGIGALLHATFVGPHFDWTSAETFGWLFGWPIMLFISFLGFLLALAVIGVIGIVVWSWLDTIGQWQVRRAKRRG